MRYLIAGLAGLMILVPYHAVRGALLYSVNMATDELVTIDTDTGGIDVVGSIGQDMHFADLTALDGRIYAVAANSADFFSGDGFTLLSINPSTGVKLSAASIFLGATEVSVAESVTAAGGELIVGFHPTDLISTLSGIVDPQTGEITDDQFHGGIDLDGLATDAAGQIIAVDSVGSGLIRQLNFYNISRGPPTSTFLGGFSIEGTFLDTVTTPFGMFALNPTAPSLIQIDLSGAPSIAATIPLDSAGTTLTGLAFVVPEPSTLILFCLLASLAIPFARWLRGRAEDCIKGRCESRFL